MKEFGLTCLEWAAKITVGVIFVIVLGVSTLIMLVAECLPTTRRIK